MRLTAIVMARALAFVEVQELNPKGKAFFPDIAAALVKRFNFKVFPTKPEEFNEQTGIEFTKGQFSEGTIDRVQIFTHGILLDTRISTDASAQLLNDMLLWAKGEFVLDYDERMIKRRASVSQVVFESDLKLNRLNPVLQKLGSAITSRLSASMGQPVNYETTGVLLNLDQSTSKLTPGAFTIERRAEVPFVDNKYFSSAPLSTADHLTLLEEFEKALL
jgi:hypothetical protein